MLFALLRGLLGPLFLPQCEILGGEEYIPKEGPFVVAVNHVDYLDGFFIAAVLINAGVRNMKILTATSNYWWTGATIPIDPTNKALALEKAAHTLKGRTAVCIFVEGERNTNSVMRPAKTGIARLALASKLPVLPIGIIAKGNTSFWKSISMQVRHKNPYSITIGAPLTFNQEYDKALTHELLTEITNRIQKAISPLCHKSIETSL